MTAADLSAMAKKQPLGVACLIVTLVCGAALYFRADAIGASQTEYDAKSSEAAKMIDNVKAAPGLEEQLAEIQSLGNELESRLVKASQLAVNLQYFYKLEADNGVKFLDLRQNAPARAARGPAPKTIFTPLAFNVTVQGDYGQLVKFLADLQNGRHFCRINSAIFTRAGSDGGSASQTMTLALTLELLGQP